MRYVLAKETISLVAQAHKYLTGKPAEFEASIEVTDARMASIIDALGGTIISMDWTAKRLFPRATSGNPIIEDEKKADEAKSVKLCQICQTRPVASSRAKICNDPACKREVQRRYNQKYLQRKRTEEEPDQDTPLSRSDRDLPDSVFGMTHVISETAAVPAE